MAFKIKDNLDLNGYILQNFCIDNYDSLDSISDKGLGRAVFLTGNATDGKYHHVNIYDGTGFRALAYLDEIANNAAFVELQEKVDTLIGDEVDMDGIIESWKEVEAFLSGMSDTKSLMDLLNSKLDKSGGTMTGELTVPRINIKTHSLFINTSDEWIVTDAGWQTEYKLLHSGNFADQIGDYYLKTSGGTISGKLTIGKADNTAYNYLQLTRSGHGIRINNIADRAVISFGAVDSLGNFTLEKSLQLGDYGLYYSPDDSTNYLLLHSGNVGEYALPLSGGTMNENATIHWAANNTEDYTAFNSGFRLLQYNSTEGQYRGGIHVGSYYGWQMTRTNQINVLQFRSYDRDNAQWLGWKTIAFTDSDITGNAATATRANYLATQKGESNDWYADQYKIYAKWINEKTCEWRVTDGTYEVSVDIAKRLSTPRTIWGRSFDGTADVSGDLHLNQSDIYWNNDKANYCIESVNRTDASPYLKVAHYGGIEFHTGMLTRMLINTSGNVTIGGSDLAGTNAKLYVDGKVSIGTDLILNGKTAVYTNSATSHLVFGSTGITSYWRGSEHIFQSGASNATAITINSSGNVLIGATEDSGRNGDLIVGTGATIRGYASVDSITKVSDLEGKGLCISALESRNAWGMVMWTAGNGKGFIQQQSFGDNATTYALSLNPFGGNVGIGTTEPDEKLHVVGNLHVTGNIIADGEVSAGGVGEEGTGAGSGASIYATTIGRETTTKTINHGLNTRDVVISIYEKDSGSTSEVWNMILTDIEIVDANNIRVTFGSATTVEHKVVIFGAVA